MNPMQRTKLAGYSLIFAISWALVACGGSSSETPMPLEPKPHATQPEPATQETSASETGNVGSEAESDPASDPAPDATETNNY